jgi:hypothetical protein
VDIRQRAVTLREVVHTLRVGFPAAADSISPRPVAEHDHSPARAASRAVKALRGATASRVEAGDLAAGSILRQAIARTATTKPVTGAITVVADITVEAMADTTAAIIIPVIATDSATTAEHTAIPLAIMTNGATGFPAAGAIPIPAATTAIKNAQNAV